jgi:hypothetical protein
MACAFFAQAIFLIGSIPRLTPRSTHSTNRRAALFILWAELPTLPITRSRLNSLQHSAGTFAS